MLSILICAFVAAATTYACWLWQLRQLREKDGGEPSGTGRRLLQGLLVGWTGLMTPLLWISFVDPIRPPETFPLLRLGASLLVGGAFVAVGSLWAVLAHRLLGNAPKVPVWRALNPIGIQVLLIMFSGLALQSHLLGGHP